MIFEVVITFFSILARFGKALMAVIAFLWTLPNTLIGLFIGFVLTFGKPKWKYGMIIFNSGKGVSKFIRRFGAHTVTFGFVVIFWEPEYANDGKYLVHERHHVSQYKILGPLFLPLYGFFLILSRGSQGPSHVLEARAYEKMDNYMYGHLIIDHGPLHDMFYGAIGFLILIVVPIYFMFII